MMPISSRATTNRADRAKADDAPAVQPRKGAKKVEETQQDTPPVEPDAAPPEPTAAAPVVKKAARKVATKRSTPATVTETDPKALRARLREIEKTHKELVKSHKTALRELETKQSSELSELRGEHQQLSRAISVAAFKK